jgi:hypothetical protein
LPAADKLDAEQRMIDQLEADRPAAEAFMMRLAVSSTIKDSPKYPITTGKGFIADGHPLSLLASLLGPFDLGHRCEDVKCAPSGASRQRWAFRRAACR